MKKEITLTIIKAFGQKIIAGQKAGRELANLCIETFQGGTRAEIIESLAAICRTDTAWKRNKDGAPLGFNHKSLNGIPSVMAFRSARVLIYSDLHEDGHVLSTEEKEAAKKAASEKAASEKAAQKAAIISETLKGVKELTPGFALNFLKDTLSTLPLGTKERKDAEKALSLLALTFGIE